MVEGIQVDSGYRTQGDGIEGGGFCSIYAI